MLHMFFFPQRFLFKPGPPPRYHLQLRRCVEVALLQALVGCVRSDQHNHEEWASNKVRTSTPYQTNDLI